MRELMRAMRDFFLAEERGAEATIVAEQKRRVETLVAAYRAEHGMEALGDEALRGLLHHEQERVIAAVVLGEVLAPILLERIGHLQSFRPAEAHQPSARPGPHRSPPRREAAPAIADLIDGMLLQEEAPAPRRT